MANTTEGDGMAGQLASRIAGSGGLSQATRARTATFRQPGRQGGQKNRFPMPDRKHAQLALQFLPRAKNMPPGMAQKVRSRAEQILAQ